jgi:signal transduction histidine kinase
VSAAITRTRRIAVLQFALTGLTALALVAVGAAWASRAAGTDEAVRDARDVTTIFAHGIVEPELTIELLRGDPEAMSDFDGLVRDRILRDPSIARIKIWSQDGRIVYSDEPRLTGNVFVLDAETLDSFDTGEAQAEISDLEGPENRYEDQDEQLLEVYLAIVGPDGEPLLFEMYFLYDTVVESAGRIGLQFAPTVFGGLLLLELVQIPLAWRLASRLSREQERREDLLQQAIDASDLERRRIARDLHDGTVQELAGVAYTLAGVGEQLAGKGDTEHAAAVRGAADETRRSIGALRSLFIEIYPPNLHETGLESAITGLLTPLAARGVETSLRFDIDDRTEAEGGGGQPLSRRVEALFFRAAQEALRNVSHHAQASAVGVQVAVMGTTATLRIQDDGIGFDTSVTGPSSDLTGHVGLRLLSDLAAEAGGQLTITTPPQGGTIVTLMVPA